MVSTTRRIVRNVALALGVVLLIAASPTRAAIISVTQDGTLQDGDSTSTTTADGSGDSVSEFNNLIVGPRDDDNTDDSTFSQEFRAGLVFDISSSGSDITSALKIFLDVTTAASDNNFESGDPDFDIELYGLDSSDGTLTTGDFQASATLLATIAHADIAADTLYSLDVTSFVKGANTGGAMDVEFRLQAKSLNGTPDSDGLLVTRFDSDDADGEDTSDAPQLRTTVIPTPTALPAGLALLTLGVLRRRRG